VRGPLRPARKPYSLAMILKEMGAALSGWRVEIVATDLSPEVPRKNPRSGIYTQFEVQRGAADSIAGEAFSPRVGAMWQLNADTKAMVQFRPFNLLQDFCAPWKIRQSSFAATC